MESGRTGPSRSPGGSVKRARQRAAQGGPPRVTINPEPVQIQSSVRRGSPPRNSPTSRQYPQNPSLGELPPVPPMPSTNHFFIDASDPISRDNEGRRTTSPIRENRIGRGPPPQRPPRPSVVPSMVDPSQRSQFYQSSEQNLWDEGHMSPPGQDRFSERYSSGSSRPTTTSSGSSAGSIPDFPIASPQMTSPPIPRRSGNLGPPPSARKGGATFYSQNSYVAPIPEEQPESHNSYASSHVIPASWGDGAPDSYAIDEEDEDSINSGGRHSRAGDHDEKTGLVRKVSIGKPGKPSLKHIRSGEAPPDVDRGGPSPASSEERPKAGLGAVAAAAGTLSPPSGPDNGRMYSQLEDTSAVPAPLRPSAPISKSTSVPTSGTRTPTTPLDPRVKAVLGGLEKGGAIGSSGSATPLGSVPSSMSDRGAKRPARLNLEAVRESEQARGSSSSLPELIRRATKLASNLDRGRTASRLGFLGMLEEKEKANQEKQGRGSRSGSISDILAAFPTPSPVTPVGEKHGLRWPSPLPKSGLSRTHTAGPNSPTSYTDRQRSRKCCGMPIWAFVLLCIILVLLIAAAVVIPVTLIVLPKKSNSDTSADISACKSSNPCSNGGMNVLVNNACRCVCANGFTGSKCTTLADTACTSTDIADTGRRTYKNATLGTAIPRLLSAAQTNFSIPLNTQTMLSLFSSQNMSCTSENALVTFDGRSQRRRGLLSSLSNLDLNFEEPLISESPHEVAAPLPILIPASALPTTHAHVSLARRAQSTILPSSATGNPTGIPTSSLTANAPGGIVTSNGIIYAAPSRATAPAPSFTSSSSPSTSSSSSSSSGNSEVTPTILDFARVVVLFIFQEESLTTAVRAQERLQDALKGVQAGKSGNGYDMNSMSAGDGTGGGAIVVDFVGLTVDLGNGTRFGGGPGEG